jgi:hypothetical protein
MNSLGVDAGKLAVWGGGIKSLGLIVVDRRGYHASHAHHSGLAFSKVGIK